MKMNSDSWILSVVSIKFHHIQLLVIKVRIEMIRDGKKLPIDVQKGIPDLLHLIKGDMDIVALYLFGSFVQSALKPLSDLDFGVLLTSRMEKEQLYDKHLQLIDLFTDALRTDEIDLILLNRSPNHINYQVLKTGKLLLCNDKHMLIDFYEQTIRSYLDFKFIKDEFDTVFLKGIGYHG